MSGEVVVKTYRTQVPADHRASLDTRLRWLWMQRFGTVQTVYSRSEDILDVTADSATLGKTAGKDAAQDKPTYVSLMGLDRSRAYAGALLDEALGALAASGLADTRALQALALMVIRRGH